MNPIIGDPVTQRAVEFLKDRYTGQTCSIVGKGPSLMYIKAEHIKPGPVIALNEAIVYIQKMDLPNDIYSMQKDLGTIEPLESIWLILQSPYSDKHFPNHPKRLIIETSEIGMLVTEMSIRMVIKLAKIMGCSKINLISCDSLTNGDLRTIGENGGVTDECGSLYDYVRPLVIKDLKDIAHEFIQPTIFPGNMMEIQTMKEAI